MLTLYSFGPVANSLKPLLALYEKGLEFEHHLIDPSTFEHHSDWFKAINPRGQVPALNHDGKVVTESTVICEYLEDSFPHLPALRPTDPWAIAEMRVWTKWVDEYFCWCVSTIGWDRIIGPMTKHLTDEEFEAKIERIPVVEQQVKWRTARKGFPKEVIDEEMRKVRISIDRLETRLAESSWLAGDTYTLADVCNYSIAGSMTKNGFADVINASKTPHLLDWVARIESRPAVKSLFAVSASERPRTR